MTEFPATAHHVGLTVTDVEVSRQWYQRLLNAAPVLDEDFPAAPEHHQGSTRSSSCCQAASCWRWSRTRPPTGTVGSMSSVPGWTTLALVAPTEASSGSGRSVWTSSESSTASSPRTPPASPCPSAIQIHRPGVLGTPDPRPTGGQPRSGRRPAVGQVTRGRLGRQWSRPAWATAEGLRRWDRAFEATVSRRPTFFAPMFTAVGHRPAQLDWARSGLSSQGRHCQMPSVELLLLDSL
jgi:hypothetical protein